LRAAEKVHVSATESRQQQPFPSSAPRIGHNLSSALHLASVAAFADSRAVYCGPDGTALAPDVIAHPGVIKSTVARRGALARGGRIFFDPAISQFCIRVKSLRSFRNRAE